MYDHEETHRKHGLTITICVTDGDSTQGDVAKDGTEYRSSMAFAIDQGALYLDLDDDNVLPLTQAQQDWIDEVDADYGDRMRALGYLK